MNEWDKDFWKFIMDLELKGKPVILCGDINVCASNNDVIDPKRWFGTP